MSEARIKALETELEKIKQKYRELKRLFDHIPGNIYWKGADGKYLGVNEEQLRNASLPNEDAVIGKTIFEILPHDIAKEVDAVDSVALNQKKRICVEEYLPSDAENTPNTYFSVKTPILNNKTGDVEMMIGISHGIDFVKGYEMRLREVIHDFKKDARAKNT